jgi:hypothetical protein
VTERDLGPKNNQPFESRTAGFSGKYDGIALKTLIIFWAAEIGDEKTCWQFESMK